MPAHSPARGRLRRLAVFVLLLGLAGCSPAVPSTPGTAVTRAPATAALPATTSSTVPSTSPSPTLHAITSWTDVPLRAALDGGSMLALARFGAGFLGVGDVATSPAGATAAWSSTDGVTWSLLGTVGPSGSGIFGVAASADWTMLVATGYDRGEATAWASTNGADWRPVHLPSSVPLDEIRLDAVVAGPSGFLLLGHDTIDNGLGPNAFYPPPPPMWHSPDGQRWTSVSPPDEGVRVGLQVWSLAAGPSGFIAGGAKLIGHKRVAAVWTSRDGLAWSSAIELPDGTGATAGEGLFINAIAAGPDRTLALSGRVNDEAVGRIWVSSDGATWGPIADLRRGDPKTRILGWAGRAFISAGLAGEDPDAKTLVVQSSVDGASWSRLTTFPEPPGALPMGVATDGIRVVILAAAQDILVGPLWP